MPSQPLKGRWHRHMLRLLCILLMHPRGKDRNMLHSLHNKHAIHGKAHHDAMWPRHMLPAPLRMCPPCPFSAPPVLPHVPQWPRFASVLGILDRDRWLAFALTRSARRLVSSSA